MEEKYKKLYEDLKVLNTKLNSLEYQRKNIKSSVKKEIEIDDNRIFYEDLKKLEEINNGLIYQLQNDVMRNVYSKC